MTNKWSKAIETEIGEFTPEQLVAMKLFESDYKNSPLGVVDFFDELDYSEVNEVHRVLGLFERMDKILWDARREMHADDWDNNIEEQLARVHKMFAGDLTELE